VASIVPNISKGKVAYLAGLPGTNDAIIAVPLLASGIASDATLKDFDTLAAILAGTSDENTTMGRKTLTGVTVTVDDTTDQAKVDSDDPAWTSGEMGGGAVAKLVYCYDPDTTGGTDSDLIPLVILDCVVTPDGNAFTYQNASGGWYTASDA
jgi:hypothetical protein